jgi:dTDP-4-dehydrorhamnose 3,5-epimerase
MQNEIQLIRGGVAVDARGEVSFVNDFNFAGVKRAYLVSNHRSGFVRAWHGHKNEAKYVSVVKGAALIGAVKVDDWEIPSPDLKIVSYTISEKSPSVLFIPAGYANGFMSLTDDAKLMFFSTSTLEESLGDDYRFDARLWNIWDIEER